MLTFSFFSLLTGSRQTTPQRERATTPVNVTATERQRGVIDHGGYGYDRPLDPDLSGCDVAHIRAHLPNAAEPSANLTACRHAAVLDQEAAFLGDATGRVEPPARDALIAACRFAAEQLRDGVVIR